MNVERVALKPSSRATRPCSSGPQSLQCTREPGEACNYLEGPCLKALSVPDRRRFVDECLMVQDHERLQIGRELHDSTGQLLLALRLGVAQLKGLGHDASADTVLQEVEGLLGRMDAEIRSISFLNYPAELRDGDLKGSVRSLARGFGARTGVEAHLDIDSGLAVPPGWAGGLALLRVAQESLLNVHRHARATAVSIRLFERDGWIELQVRDNGVGIDLSRGDTRSLGVGMSGMRHRVESLGGRFAVRRLRRGTEVAAGLQRAPFLVPASHGECWPAA